MPIQETGKQRASRIPMDYYKHGDPLERWKLRLGLAALLASLVWLGTTWALTRQDDFQSSRGPVAFVHQNWENDCQACHVSFTPISGHSWQAPFLGKSSESSMRCQHCHSGVAHHAGEKPDLSCASCHRDHRGRDASLVQLPDGDCTQCHKDLSNHHGSDKSTFENSVTRFADKTHPPFQSIKGKDPGKLKFNHRLHLSPGMALKDDKQTGGPIRTLGQIPEGMRGRYRDMQENKSDSAPVELQCASCHQQDPGDMRLPADAPMLSGRAVSGAYMLPISFENHCQACHPLTVHRETVDAKVNQIDVPHRWQPRQIDLLLVNAFTSKNAKDFFEAKPAKDVPPLPGKKPSSRLPETVLEAIKKEVDRAETYLSTGNPGCALCHEFTKPTAKFADFEIVPTRVPQVWFKHAKFSHVAHRAVKCQDCHGGAEQSTQSSDILIPGQDNCVQCHAPTTTARTPGVRSTCTTCHLYHNGDHGMQGIGAARRNPAKLRSIKEFLKGE